jgi:hypothetical protein
MEVTYFKNIYSEVPHYVHVNKVLDKITDGTYSDAAYKVRSAATKEERQKYKKELPAVCFTGRFNKRLDKSCTEHSGLICLDFDGFEDINTLTSFKEKVNSDEHTFASFISPSGLGLKVIVKIPAIASEHKGYFKGLEVHFDSKYFDTTSKNPARLCFLTFDPDLYHNPDSTLFDQWADTEPEYQQIATKVLIPVSNENEIVRRLQKWHKDKFPMVSGQRNHNAFVLAKAFNDYGVSQQTATFVITQEHGQAGFDHREIEALVRSAYKDKASYGSKAFEDVAIKQETKKIVREKDAEQAVQYLTEKGVDLTKAEEVVGQIVDDEQTWNFWTITEQGNAVVDDSAYISFLQSKGFFKYYIDEDKNPDNIMFVQIHNNLVQISSVKKIRDFVQKYLRDADAPANVYNYFLRAVKLYKEDYLLSLHSIEIEFLKETKKESYLYYNNCIVKVTGDSIETISYLDIDQHIWKNALLPRDYIPADVDYQSDFPKFMNNVSKNGLRIKSMESAIGYLTTTHKNRSFSPAIILNDEVISDNPEGGTGKGIYCNAVSQMRRTVILDGKSWHSDKPFAYQTLDLDTQILIIDDVTKSFHFEGLFSIITEGLTIEKKNKDAIKVEWEDSPKVCITTNYAISGQGNSHNRRKFDLEFHQHYDKNFTPEDEFGRMLFDDWDETDWAKFDAYMVHCIQVYMNNGLVESSFDNLKTRKLSAATCHEFIEWLSLTEGSEKIVRIPVGARVKMVDLYFSFTSEYTDYSERGKHSISRAKFKRWIQSYLTEFLPDGTIGRTNYGYFVYIAEEEI